MRYFRNNPPTVRKDTGNTLNCLDWVILSRRDLVQNMPNKQLSFYLSLSPLLSHETYIVLINVNISGLGFCFILWKVQ